MATQGFWDAFEGGIDAKVRLLVSVLPVFETHVTESLMHFAFSIVGLVLGGHELGGVEDGFTVPFGLAGLAYLGSHVHPMSPNLPGLMKGAVFLN